MRRAYRIERPRRLVACMKWAAILCDTEATSCLRDIRDGQDFGGEAVNHFGGPIAVVKAAINAREIVRSLVNNVR